MNWPQQLKRVQKVQVAEIRLRKGRKLTPEEAVKPNSLRESAYKFKYNLVVYYPY